MRKLNKKETTIRVCESSASAADDYDLPTENAKRQFLSKIKSVIDGEHNILTPASHGYSEGERKIDDNVSVNMCVVAIRTEFDSNSACRCGTCSVPIMTLLQN